MVCDESRFLLLLDANPIAIGTLRTYFLEKLLERRKRIIVDLIYISSPTRINTY